MMCVMLYVILCVMLYVILCVMLCGGMIDFLLFGGFDFRWTNRWTFVLLESLSRLKIYFSYHSVILAAVLLTAPGPPGAGVRVMSHVVEDRGEGGGRSVWPLSVEDDLVTRRMSSRGWRFVMKNHVLYLTSASGHLGTPGGIGQYLTTL